MKKIIAREILIFFSSFVIYGIIILIWTFINHRFEKTVSEENKNLRSLKIQQIESNENLDLLINDFYGKYYNQVINSKKKDSIKKIYKYNPDTLLINAYKDLNKSLPLSQLQKIKKTYNLNNLIAFKDLSKINELQKKLDNRKTSFFYKQKANENYTTLAIIIFLLFFILRYFYYIIKWSLKTVKE